MRSTAQPSPSGKSAGVKVGGDVALQRHRDVDDAAGHPFPPWCAFRSGMFVRKISFVDKNRLPPQDAMAYLACATGMTD
jgi:hypothetical protein